MLDFVTAIPSYAIPFLVVLSVLVFVHEFGHYIVARWCGIRVDIFSIGFGREIFGWTDRHGTRWKFSLIPLGGYVQMFGDLDPASSEADQEQLTQMTEEEKSQTFYAQPLGSRAAVVAAGPFINFLYAIIVLTGLYWMVGQSYTPPIVGGVVETTPADQAGFQPDDKILSVNGDQVTRFQELQRYVSVNLGKAIVFEVQRGEQVLTIEATPEVVEREDNFGFINRSGRLGVLSVAEIATQEHTLLSATGAALSETWTMVTSTLQAIGQMIVGTRSTEELGGVIRIGAYAKEFSEAGIMSLVTFSAIISINLGLINLFPIPLLDGGHLLFYLGEFLRGKPLSPATQSAGMRLGYAFIIVLMVYATLNDLAQLNVFSYLAGLVS